MSTERPSAVVRVAARVARLLLRLYPQDFRRRFGDEVRRALDEAVRVGTPARRILVDAAATLVKAWADVPRGRTGGGGPGPGVGSDVRIALRSVVRDPLYAVLMVSTLAVAIGANAAVVDVSWSVLLRTLPYSEPDRVVSVTPAPVRFTATGFDVSETLTELPQIEAAAAYTAGGRASLGTSGGAAEVSVTQVSSAFFDVLGVSMRQGSGPGAATEGESVAVLSDRLWRATFGGDPAIVGRTIVLSGQAVIVAGVAPPEVDVPAGTDVWVSYPLVSSFFGAASGGDVIARTRAASLIGQARDAHLDRVRRQWEAHGEALPDWYADLTFTPLRDTLIGPVREALLVLLASASLVLLLGCVNLAGVTLARRSAGAADLAVRRALGAGRIRLMRMMLIETLVLAVIAAAPAIALLFWGRSVLRRLLPAGLPGLTEGAPALPSLGFVAIAVLFAGLAVGVVPALSALSGAEGIGVAGRPKERRRRLHPALVITEMALAVLLVIGAGLLGRSLIALRSVPLGYDVERVLTFEARLPVTSYGDAAALKGWADAVGERLMALPGVSAAGISTRLPNAEGLGAAYRVWPAGLPEPDSTISASVVHATTPFFDALGIPLLAGAGFTPGERGSVLVSRSLALSVFGSTDVVGQSLRMRFSFRAEPTLVTISGVTGDTRMGGYETKTASLLYLPWSEQPMPNIAFAIRSAGDPAALADDVRRIVAEVDPGIAPFRITTTAASATATVATRRALVVVATLFGAAALLLALLGTYGLLSQSVARRRRELGIRMAIGARGPDVMLMILGEAGRLAIAGATVGLVAAFGVTRFLTSQLWNVRSTDPITFVAVPLLILLAALGAAALPASRAVRIDPASTLRSD